MKPPKKFRSLGIDDPVWQLVRYFAAIGGNKKKQMNSFLTSLSYGKFSIPGASEISVSTKTVTDFLDYLKVREELFQLAMASLREESKAINYCRSLGFDAGTTRTQSKDHHQSSKSMVTAVTHIANEVCQKRGFEIDSNPQSRCVWTKPKLHVSARNLDGAIPGLINPSVIWEIKEYWGKTKGGSKMSDAVYECALVGTEIRDFETSAKPIQHIVFVDGKDQWGVRKSDLKRFIDLLSQGLIDNLIIGDQVEDEWEPLLNSILKGLSA